MTDRIAKHLKNGWAAYGSLVLIIGGITAAASIPGRVSALERRMETQETVGRYTACTIYYEARGVDATPCETHLKPDVLDYLRPQ